MSVLELFITAVALSMDAFAVAICKGLSTGKVRIKHMVIVGAWFGGFQALMPLIGYLLGSTFADYITPVDHWIAFVLLALLGANMIKEALSSCDECENTDASLAFRVMLTMAVATSIDALAVGISFAMLPDVNIWIAIGFIGAITFTLSAIGVKVGSVFGAKNKKYAELLGGIILILMGTKILLEHLGVINF
jgi:putative Mn2+ efflux pump MntP